MHHIGGDFQTHELAERARAVTGDAVGEYRARADHQPALAYACTVEHAESIAAAFRAAGYRSECVHGGLPVAERDALIEGLGNGAVEVLTSCDLISEGLDVPSVGAVILLRPTESLALALQQIGRGMRPAEGKKISPCSIMPAIVSSTACPRPARLDPRWRAEAGTWRGRLALRGLRLLNSLGAVDCAGCGARASDRQGRSSAACGDRRELERTERRSGGAHRQMPYRRFVARAANRNCALTQRRWLQARLGLASPTGSAGHYRRSPVKWRREHE